MLNDDKSKTHSGFVLEKKKENKVFIDLSLCMPIGCVLYKASLKKDLHQYEFQTPLLLLAEENIAQMLSACKCQDTVTTHY